MIDNSKEYIVCAAYLQAKNTAHRQYMIDTMNKDPKSIYHKPHDDVFDMRLGFRHPDIIYQFKDEINSFESDGGFMTSKGRYVDRIEAMKIAYECGQVTKEKALRNDDSNIKYWPLYSEDIY